MKTRFKTEELGISARIDRAAKFSRSVLRIKQKISPAFNNNIAIEVEHIYNM